MLEILKDLELCISRSIDPMPITVAIGVLFDKCGISSGIFKGPDGVWEAYGYRFEGGELQAQSGWVIYGDADIEAFIGLLKKIGEEG